ncbi:MAG: hypothetical protein EOP51_27780, partial [Sphingobacteriales bacterium]
TGSTDLLTANDDDTPTATAADIGFTFKFKGVNYTKYSVSPDGWLLLGAGAAVNEFTNSTISTTNTPKLYPFWDDLATGTDGNVKAVLKGTAGNHILVIEWNVTVPRNTTGAVNSKFQMWLYEGTNTVEYRYGTMGTPISGSISAGYTVNATTFNSITFSSNTASSATAYDGNSTAPATGTIYSYLQPTDSTVWSPVTDLYTDAAATTPYTGQQLVTVYAKPTTTRTYTATASNTVGCSTAQTVTVTNNSPVVPAIDGPSSVCTPSTITLSDTTAGGTWTSSDNDVATVSSTGVVTAVAAGSVTITYTVTANGCTSTATKAVTVTNQVVIVNSTSSETVVAGSQAVFSVNATGSGLTYQWYVSTDAGATYNALADNATYTGTTTSSLQIDNVPASFDGYLYQAVVSGSGSCGSATTAAALLTVGNTGISAQPADFAICSGGAGTATFSVTGSGSVTGYQWYQDQGAGFTALTDGTVGGVTYSGSTTGTLSLSGLGVANSGWKYRAIVSGTSNSATSNIATLTVNVTPSVTGQPANTYTCYSGGSTTFTATTSGNVSSYQWQYSADGTTWNNVANNAPANVSYS